MIIQPTVGLKSPATSPPSTAANPYAVRIASSQIEVQAAQALRFNVFNLELNEGLAESYETGLDADAFDAVCNHLLVEHVATHTVVGTYRLQTGAMAAAKLGYYSAQEFDFAPYEPLREQVVELGRACVDRLHRNLIVLGLLWKGIVQYAVARDCRYLIGCSSLTSVDPAVGARVFSDVCRRHLVQPALRTKPWPHCECSLRELSEEGVEVPKLLRAYLGMGARICGVPAIDRQFGTIDFLTLLDLEVLPAQARSRLLGA
jgi:putative hemolysin